MAQQQASKAQERYGQLANWAEIKHEASKPENYVSGRAADHFKNYESDFDIAQKLHLNTIRSGIEWSRIEPEEGGFDAAALKHYQKYFNSLKTRGITPVVTLWHWTFPEWFAAKGGFLKRKNIKFFSRYVKFIVDNLGVEFEYIITINEPTVYTTMSYFEKRWPPQQSSMVNALRVLINLASAHKKSYRLIKKAMPNSQIGLAHNCSYFYSNDKKAFSKLFVSISHKLGNEFFINRVRRYQDFLGVNYYFANRFVGTKIDNSDFPVNDLGWPMQPDKLGPLLVLLGEKYKRPVLVTESGVADAHDTHRKWWILEGVQSVRFAQKHGIDMLGYIHWSLLDNFEWAEGFWPRFGLEEVDYTTGKRTIRKSALWYGALIKKLEAGRHE